MTNWLVFVDQIALAACAKPLFGGSVTAGPIFKLPSETNRIVFAIFSLTCYDNSD